MLLYLAAPKAAEAEAVDRAKHRARLKRLYNSLLEKGYTSIRNDPRFKAVEAASHKEAKAVEEARKYFLTSGDHKVARLATFASNCLEFRLDRRQTFYQFGDKLAETSDSARHNLIKILISVSGSGKTRQLLELLYTQHGYYFVTKESKDFGSGDLNYCRIISDLSPHQVEYYIFLLYLVRVVICDSLKKSFGSEFSSPRTILLAQLHPIKFFGCDIFKMFYSYLINISDQGTRIAGIEESIKKRSFDFVAIDEIQSTLGGNRVYTISDTARPFFSPLIYYSALGDFYSKFIVSGTGINFQYIRNMLQSSTMKDVELKYEVIQGLEPLNEARAKEYITDVLEKHGKASLVTEAVEKISKNPVFLGRGRFIAFILDRILLAPKDETAVVDAMRSFMEILSDPTELAYPLRFYVEEKTHDNDPFEKPVGNTNLGAIIRNGLINCLYFGRATLNVAGQEATDTVRYGIGFCRVEAGIVSSVELQEQAIVLCLRHIFPIRDLIVDICVQLATCPQPAMVGYILEFLVAAALVANLNKECLNTLKPFCGKLESYLSADIEDAIVFPDNLCGPDIIYKYKGIVHIVQVKFVKKISKQKVLDAAHTTDYNLFYTNRSSKAVLNGCEERRKNILQKLKGALIKRYLVIHSDDCVRDLSPIDGVTLVTEKSQPEFFASLYQDPKNNHLWNDLSKLRRRFKELQEKTSSA
ncbi:hypothetical protein HDU96_010007 [Phlyctochytrium bullatum]|nr:hypothetical protein HDU96_010007 [Phlyctochytrium bullatum]